MYIEKSRRIKKHWVILVEKLGKLGLFMFVIFSLIIGFLFIVLGITFYLFYPLDYINMGPTYEGWYPMLFGVVFMIYNAPRVIRYFYNLIVKNDK